MKVYLSVVVTVIQLVLRTKSKHWALIAAGSNTWPYYRHQADACHAYQVVHSHGIPEENTVLMIYDDIAYNPQNPHKGTIINKPDGPNVYKGVRKDYTGDNVTSQNFLDILQGNKAAMQGIGNGKVIDSGPDDNIFVYYTGLGATGFVTFPTGELMAHHFLSAIKSMYESNKYNKMVIYVEASFAGSLFSQLLPVNTKVYAVTAANANEGSYACYFDPQLNVYLGDVFSVNWLQDSDMADFTKVTLEQQYEVVKAETNTSNVTTYGDLTFDTLTLNYFQGYPSLYIAQNEVKFIKNPSAVDAVPAPDVKIWILKRQLLDDSLAPEKRQEIMKELEKEKGMRYLIRSTFHNIVKRLVDSPEEQRIIISSPTASVEYQCYKQLVNKFKKHCKNIGMGEYTLSHMYVLANLCNEGYSTKRIVKAIQNVCMASVNTNIVVN